MIRSTEERTEHVREGASEVLDGAAAERGAAGKSGLPAPHLKRAWWPFPLVWILPIIAAGMAAYYGFTHLQQRGPQIVINFTDGSGLKANETMITHLGVQIGTVTGMELSPDKKTVRVNATLARSQGAFAKDGAVYWTVRPQISVENVSGLNTVLSGPYIEAMPGVGGDKTEFDGLQKAPTDYGQVVNFVLHAPRLEHLSPDAPVYFRGIEVGMIKGIDLSPDASGIDVHIFVRHRFSDLVQTDSKFWLVKGADIKGGLLSGLKVELGSLQEIVSGGVEFATPENGEGAIAKDGASFPLYDEYKKEWMDWSPRIPVLPDETSGPDKSVDLPQTPEAAKSLVN
jgi:paraquat-inducible protein B